MQKPHFTGKLTFGRSILFIQIILAAISVVPSELEKQMRGYYDEDSDDDYQHGEVVMYAPEKPEDVSYYSPQAPTQAHPYSPLPQKQPISYPETTNNYELSDLPSKAVLESQRQSQQYPPPSFTPQPPTFTPSPPSKGPYAPPQTYTPQPPNSRPQSQVQNQTQSAFAQNLMQTYLQHSPAGRAITTSEPTPPLSSSDLPPHRPSSTTKITTLPVFDPPPTVAAVAPTPRTVAFNRLTGREKTEAEKIVAARKKEGGGRFRLFASGREEHTPVQGQGQGQGGKERLEKERKEGRKERKEREKREKEEERKRGVERYFELQRAGPPSLYGRGPQREVDWVQEGRGEWDGGMQPMYRGSSYGAQGYGQQERQQQVYGAGYAQVRGHGQSGGLPFRERYGA